MKSLPIVEHYRADPTAREIALVDRLARALRRERPKLAIESGFQDLVPDHIDAAPTLHLDDLSAIPHLDCGLDARFYQERARLRAGAGDLVVTSKHVPESYEDYCRDQLGLGSVDWLHPIPMINPLSIAEACWEDEEIQRRLIRKMRSGELCYVHPHMGTFSVWELAALLRMQPTARSV